MNLPEKSDTAAPQQPRVYLAGKVEKNGWRHDLVTSLRGWKRGDGPINLPRFVYVGPWVLSCDHGCRHHPGSHGLAGSGCSGVLISRREVFTGNQAALLTADMVFAFIDARDAYGTIAEIGFAANAGIPVFLCFGPNLDRDDLWYVELMTELWEGPLTVHRDELPCAFNRALLRLEGQRVSTAAISPDCSTAAKMKVAKRWLIYCAVPRSETGKIDKRPYYTNGIPRGKTDTALDRANLATIEEARKAVAARDGGWGLGFALGEDEQGKFWQGIDFDDVEENGLANCADNLPGYVEKSPSGKGVHAIGYGRIFKSLGPNNSGIEAYSSGRFFTVTGKRIRDGALTCLADFVEERLAQHHSSVRAPAAGTPAASPVQAVAAKTVAELRSALNHLRADEYSLWVRVGLALKSLGDVGRGLWLDWSVTSPKFEPQVAAEKWDGFDPQRMNYRTVFSEAQAAGWVNPASRGAKLDGTAERAPSHDTTTTPPRISATPFAAPALADIPPRPWLFGRWLLCGTVTAVIAPGGTGKSALMAAAALSLASGKEILGKTVRDGPKRVWLWNLEDDCEELARQIAACASHHGLSEKDCRGRLFVNGADMPLCIGAKNGGGFSIDEISATALTAEIGGHGIDVLIIDPFVSSHRLDENDNGQIDAVVKRLAAIARDAGCAVVIVHHSSKRYGQAVDTDASRGASALTNGARTVLALNRMEKGEAVRFGISEAERWHYVRVSNEKANRAPAGESDWFRLVSVNLGNGGPDGGDQLGVLERWTPPNAALEAFTFSDAVRAAVQAKIASGEWRASGSAADWAGKVVAEVIGADLATSEGSARAKSLLKDMLAKGQLRIERRTDSSRHVRPFVIAGKQIEADCDSPAW